MSDSQVCLRVCGVSKSFSGPGRQIRVLEDIHLQIRRGEFVSIIGPSGCGKSTLLNLLAGLELPDSGQIEVRPEGMGSPGRHHPHPGMIGIMLQKDYLLPWKTTLENVALGMELQGCKRSQSHRNAASLMERFGLSGFEKHFPSQLSGGMRQRAALLRTVAAGQDILLLDEPFAAMDALTRRKMQSWLLEVWAALGKTILLVTHDIEEAILLSDRVLVMAANPGRIIRQFEIRLPRPRHADMTASTEFNRARTFLLEALSNEPMQHGSLEMESESVRRPAEHVGSGAITMAPWMAVLGSMAFWELIVRWLGVPGWLLPAPSQILTALLSMPDVIAGHAWATISSTLLGLMAAIALALAAAVLMHVSPLAERSFLPLIVASQSLPGLALAPLLAVWFGYGLAPKVIMVAILCFFPIAVNAIDGFKRVERGQVDSLLTLGATPAQLFRCVFLPSALFQMFSGLKVAVSYAAVGAMVGEWVGSSQGLGYFMLRSSSQFLTDRVFAAIVVLAAIGMSLFHLVDILQKRLLPWLETEKRRTGTHQRHFHRVLSQRSVER